jgi:hypothetical protein
MAFWAFLILTVLSLVAENTGLLKAGSQPMEFEPEEGKVVKFDDVHGCEEAKTVSIDTGAKTGCSVLEQGSRGRTVCDWGEDGEASRQGKEAIEAQRILVLESKTG